MRYRYVIGLVSVCMAMVGCARGEPPHHQLAQSQAALRAAEEVGAAETPDAALHLRLARDQMQAAEMFIHQEEYATAAAVLKQAELDAELALAIARRADAVERAAQTRQQLQAIEKQLQGGDASETNDASDTELDLKGGAL